MPQGPLPVRKPAQPAQPSNGHSRADVKDTLKDLAQTVASLTDLCCTAAPGPVQDFLTFAAMFASERKTYKRDIAEVNRCNSLLA